MHDYFFLCFFQIFNFLVVRLRFVVHGSSLPLPARPSNTAKLTTGQAGGKGNTFSCGVFRGAKNEIRRRKSEGGKREPYNQYKHYLGVILAVKLTRLSHYIIVVYFNELKPSVGGL